MQEMLERRGARYEYIHFPRFGAPVYGDMIARFLRGEFGELDAVDPYIVALLFAGDRADAGPMIDVWLSEGKFVILDRYVNSNIAFQCAKCGGEARRQELKRWILDTEFVQFGIPRPDMSLFLDVPFEFTSSKLSGTRSGEDREYLQGGRDIHEESLDFQRRVREMYLELAGEDDRMHVIDCSDEAGGMAAPKDIFARIEAKITTL